MNKEEKVIRKTYIKLSLRLKSNSDVFILKLFTISDIANLILGFLFFISIFLLKNEMNITEKVIQFNIMTSLTIALFVVQKENFMVSEQEKLSIFLVAPISKKTMRRMNFMIDLLSTTKNVLLFQIPYIIYMTINYGIKALFITILSTAFISVFTYFVSELIRIIVAMTSKYISFMNKVKSYLLVFILTIIYYIVSHNISFVSKIDYLFPNMISNVLSFENNFSVNLKLLLIVFVISFFLIVINYFILSIIRINIPYKENEKEIKLPTTKTYQDNTIEAIVNSLVMNDEDTGIAYLEQSLKIFTGLAWGMLVLSLTGIFSSIYYVLIAASIMTAYRCSGQILSFLYSKTPGALEMFKIYPSYTDLIVSRKATMKVIKSKFIFVIVPLIIINVVFGYSNFKLMILSNVSTLMVFFGGVFINYRYLLKYKPFFYSKNDEARPSEFIPNLIYIALFMYIIIALPLSKFSIIVFIILFSFFIIPTFLLLFVLSKPKSDYGYPFIKQKTFNDCGVAAMKMITVYYQKSISKILDDQYGENKYYGSSFKDLQDIGKQVGLKMTGYRINELDLLINNSNLHPYIAHVAKGGINHFIVVYETQENYLIVGDPSKGKITTLKLKRFKKMFNRNILISEGNDKNE